MKSKKPSADEAATDSKSGISSEIAGEDRKNGTSRRAFIGKLGIGATLLALAGQAFAFFRSLVPNVLYEEPMRFKIGTPDQFGEGAKFIEDKRVYVFRERNTFYAISAVCTHLGCTVKLQRLNQPKRVKVRGREFDEQAEFHCPCHGSKYHGDGTNYAGPAPRSLAYHRVEVSPDDGQLIVDLSQNVGQDFRLTV